MFADPKLVIDLSEATLDSAILVAQIERTDCGGLVVFEGRVRTPSDGKEVAYLEYEAFLELARKQFAAIASEATDRFGLRGVVAVHRTGIVDVGGVGVIVATTAPHRAEAFDGAREVIDRIKHEAAIWKREVYVDGSSAWARCPH